MNPIDTSDAGPSRPAAAEGRPSHGCPECFGRLLYNGSGYSCIACEYRCPLLGCPPFSARGRTIARPRPASADHT